MNNNLLSSNIEENSNQSKNLQIIYLYYFFPKMYQNLGIGFFTLLIYLLQLDFSKLNMLSLTLFPFLFFFSYIVFCVLIYYKKIPQSSHLTLILHITMIIFLLILSITLAGSYYYRYILFIPYISTGIVSAIISALLYYTDLQYLRLKVNLPLVIGIIILMVLFLFHLQEETIACVIGGQCLMLFYMIFAYCGLEKKKDEINKSMFYSATKTLGFLATPIFIVLALFWFLLIAHQ